MRREWSTVILAIAVWGLCHAAAAGQASAPADEAALQARSLVSAGDPARLERVLARAKAGDPVTVAVIGGSITAGAKASKRENRYGDLMARWWRQKFPQAKIEYVNAGIGATGTNFGSLRVRRDLLSKHPDFVVVEYAVNDLNTPLAAETLEGLLRQILSEPNQPAVVLLFTMRRDGSNSQEWHGKIGAHYELPMVSFRDALWPEIKAGRMQWTDVEADMVHPNDRGHAYCSTFVTVVLDGLLQKLPARERLPEVEPLPRPAISDLFQRTSLFEAGELKPVVNRGWAYDAKTKAWRSDRPASVIEFDLSGRVIYSMHYVIHGPMGMARVSVDGKPQRELNAWFDQTWGGYRQTNEIARLAQAGTHRVRFELLDAKSPKSEGREFRILGLGAAGLP
jgi:lysophospholipase L1-like esterase